MKEQTMGTTRWVDFAEVRQAVSLEQVLFDLYRLDTLKRHGDKVVGPCPVHGGDGPRAFHADLKKNVWHCFSSCKRGGNQLDFVAAYEDTSIREAALKLQDHFMGGSSTKPPRSKEPNGHPPRAPRKPDRPPEPASSEPNPPLEVRLKLSPDHPHLVDTRRLAPETIAEFGVGYCAKGIMKGTIAIPIHDENGVLVAYAGRRLRPSHIREQGKYKFPKGFRKELVLYNLHRASLHSGESGFVLVEGFFSVLKLVEAGVGNVVASMGCELSEAQARLVADRAGSVLVLYDGNPAGYGGADLARERLEALGVTVRIVRLPEGGEPDDLQPQALRWLINGMQVLDLAEVAFTPRSETPEPASQ